MSLSAEDRTAMHEVIAPHGHLVDEADLDWSRGWVPWMTSRRPAAS
jgi:hypothetical protein